MRKCSGVRWPRPLDARWLKAINCVLVDLERLHAMCSPYLVQITAQKIFVLCRAATVQDVRLLRCLHLSLVRSEAILLTLAQEHELLVHPLCEEGLVHSGNEPFSSELQELPFRSLAAVAPTSELGTSPSAQEELFHIFHSKA